MKKMLVIHFLQVAMIATLLFVLKRTTQHLAVIEQELIGIRREQVKASPAGPRSISESVLRVYVVNEPDVRINGTVDVNLENEVDVNVTNSSIPVEIDR